MNTFKCHTHYQTKINNRTKSPVKKKNRILYESMIKSDSVTESNLKPRTEYTKLTITLSSRTERTLTRKKRRKRAELSITKTENLFVFGHEN